MKILFLIRSLSVGGAERQLIELSKGFAKLGSIVHVCTFYPGGSFEEEILNTNVSYVCLRKKGRWDIISFFCKIIKLYNSIKPDVVYSFQGPSCIVSTLARSMTNPFNNVWGIRSSNVDLKEFDWFTRLSYRVECFIAGFADLIIANTQSGRLFALSNHFPVEKTIVIPNGIDIDRFKPNFADGRIVRQEWKVSDDEILIGMVARLDPLKDHQTFIEAAAKLLEQNIKVRFVCVGSGLASYQAELQLFANRYGLGTKLHWAGSRDDMPNIYNALDILVLSSYSEGFPNVIAEAMACGVPCVATDVGDSRFIVGDEGFIVPPKEPGSLAEKLVEMINKIKEHNISPAAVRQHIVDNYSISSMLERTIAAIHDKQN